ncbi:MAG: Gfo/Idh/MocA family oxidoreductase [Deltaproteobacteria bacterium]|nr:Gfo/Idh/MocA family oxidoreductase [Deltaproteobacteria bacterium]MBI3077798.1 Gfo/Idh/MocA family oxidoreductase [Deltaproteobacteria bacterium]
MGRVRIGVVGVGHVGTFHAERYASLPEAELVAVADINPERLRVLDRQLRVRGHLDYKELYGEVEAVSIAVPTAIHYEVARDFLDQGMDVLLEKPMATSLSEAEDLIQRAMAGRRILQIGHSERFNPAILALRDRGIAPRFIECHRLAPFGPRGTDVDVILDLMIHDLDIILDFVRSEVVGIDAVGVPVLSSRVDIANVRLRFANGCVANVTASRVSAERMRKIRIFQPDAYVSVDYAAPEVLIYRLANGDSGLPGIIREEVTLPRADALEMELRAFLDSVLSRRPPAVSGADGRRALEVALRIAEML